MIGKKVSQALNTQMNREFYNARLYLAMAAYLHSINMEGAAHWMEIQSQEETGHAMRLCNHLRERGARIVIGDLEAPPAGWDSVLAAYESAYEHECKVSGQFDEHVKLARTENDNATLNFLQWFVNEQVEEEASVDAVIQQLKLTQNAPGAMYMLDRNLAQRVLAPAAPDQAQT